MAAENPAYIPRNHLVEAALDDAVERDDFEAFNEVVQVLQDPFTYRDEHHDYALPPRPDQRVQATFCGT